MKHGNSVVVPVEPTPRMLAATWGHEIDKSGGIESQNTRNARIWSAMLSAVPASLAGVEVNDGGYDRSDVRYGLHMIANEDCDEVAASYYAKKALAHLAALSPEAPAREGEEALRTALIKARSELAIQYCYSAGRMGIAGCYPELAEKYGGSAIVQEIDAVLALTPRHEAPARDGVALDKRIADAAERDRRERDKAFRGESYEPLTPRHEAPASPTERELDLLDAVMRAGGIVKTAAALPDKAAHLSLLTDALNRADAILTEGLNGAPVRHEAPAEPCASHRSMGFHIDPRCPHCEAPAEGAGERQVLAKELERLAECEGGIRGGSERAAETMRQAAKHLRARSSAPEAREEALGNLLAVIHGDGGHRALEVGVEQAAAEAEKIVAGLFAALSPEARDAAD